MLRMLISYICKVNTSDVDNDLQWLVTFCRFIACSTLIFFLKLNFLKIIT